MFFNLQRKENKYTATIFGIRFKFNILNFIDKLPIGSLNKFKLKTYFSSEEKYQYEIRYHKFSYDEVLTLLECYQIYPKNIMSIEETINYTIDNKVSISRIGDGEELLHNMLEEKCKYKELGEKLRKICAQGSNDKCLVCINNFDADSSEVPLFHRKAFAYYWGIMVPPYKLKQIEFAKQPMYGDAFAFAFYFKDDDDVQTYEKKKKHIKQIWKGRKVLFVVNNKSLILSDNDAFDNVESKDYVFGPSHDAYSEYPRIKNEILEKFDKDWLIYIEMGACASVLAYELSQLGYQALDMGSYYYRIYTMGKKLHNL